jgi:hypothetical protein
MVQQKGASAMLLVSAQKNLGNCATVEMPEACLQNLRRSLQKASVRFKPGNRLVSMGDSIFQRWAHWGLDHLCTFIFLSNKKIPADCVCEI